MATERDLLAAMRRSGRLYELVDGTLVEKAIGLRESMIALMISRRIGNFAEEHDLGICAGADGDDVGRSQAGYSRRSRPQARMMKPMPKPASTRHDWITVSSSGAGATKSSV
jgi:hypothetical protein